MLTCAWKQTVSFNIVRIQLNPIHAEILLCVIYEAKLRVKIDYGIYVVQT